MVFIKSREVIVTPSVDPDQGDFPGIDLLQGFAVADGDQPVAGAVNDIGMAFYTGDPFIGSQVETEHHPYRQDGQKTFHHFPETVIGRIQDQVAGIVITGEFGGETASHTAAINDQVIFRVLIFQAVINELHVSQHFLFTSFAGAFPEAPVIHQHHIIIIAVKIPCITGPALYAAGIAMKIEDEPLGFFPVKMQSVDPHPRFNIKEVFPERGVIPELKILPEFLGFENEFFLQEIGQYRETGDADDDIPDKMDGKGFWLQSVS